MVLKKIKRTVIYECKKKSTLVRKIILFFALLIVLILSSCGFKVPDQSNENPSKTYNTKPQVVNVELDNWNTLPGDLSFEILGTADGANKVYFDIDVNGKDYSQGSADVIDDSFVISEVIDSNLNYSNIEPLNVDVKLSLNSDFSTPTEYSTAITLPVAIMGRKAPDQVEKIDELIDLYESGNESVSYQELKSKAIGIVDRDGGDLYTVFEFRKGNVVDDYWYGCRVNIYSYEGEQKDSLIAMFELPHDVYINPLEGSSVVYDVIEYNAYKDLSLDEFINTYLSTVATPIDNDSVEMLLSSEAFNKLVEQDEHFIPLSYRRVYVVNNDFDPKEPVFCGLYVLDNYVSFEEGTTSKEPLQTLEGVLIFPKNRGFPVNFLVSSKTGNLLEVGSFHLDGVGTYNGEGPFLNSPYLRDALNQPGAPSEYNYDVDMITQFFDMMDTVFSETRILTPQEFKDIFSTSYNRGVSRLDEAIEVIDGLTLP